MKRNMLGLAALAVLCAAGARADDPPKPADPPKAEDKAGKPASPGTRKQVDKLAAEFSVKKEEVAALRAKGLGWGEIRHALTLSSRTGKPVGDIMKMRDGGMGWGEIANKEGVKLEPEHGAGKEGGARAGGEPRSEGAGHGAGPKEHGHGRVK